MKKILILMFFSVGVWADTIEVDYASFYSHVKKLDDPDTNALRFAFGFKHISKQRLCKLLGASIVTQKQTLPLEIESNNRFAVPTDKVLKMAKAKVVIEIDDNANQCDMSVQLETLPSYLKTTYNQEELQVLFRQYQAFFEEMGGFLSFLMPTAEGLVFHFNANTELPEELTSLLDDNGNLSMPGAVIEKGYTLNIPIKPLRVTALVKK